KQEAYWIKEFETEVPVLNVPTDFKRPVIQSFEGNSVDFFITTGEVNALKKMASGEGSTLYMMMLAIYKVLLFKLSGNEDIAVGTLIAGRSHADVQSVIGMFVNTLVIRSCPEGKKSFRNFLGEVKEKILKAFENQDYQFEDLVEKVTVKRDAGRNPLFDVTFTLETRDEQPEDTRPGEPPDEQNAPEYDYRISKFDLTLTTIESGKDLSFSLRYSTKLFKPETIERFIAYFKRIISRVPQNRERLLSDVEVISEEEKKQILYEFNDTGAEFPGGKTIHRLFEEQAGISGDRTVAAAPADGSNIHITYNQLNEKADGLAQTLRAKGCGPGSIISIIAHPSIQTMVGIMAVLKTGGCYLPIDPMYPGGRITYILNDSETKIVLSQSHQPVNDAFDVEILNIEAENLSVRGTNDGLAETATPTGNAGPGSPVYMIYTSGTTGNPKGVLLKHENLVNYTTWFSTTARLTWDDKSALLSSFAFDLGYTAVYPTILNGGQLHILTRDVYMFPPDLLAYIRTRRISYLKMTPSLFSTIVSDADFSGKTCRSLRLVLLGGEAINTADVETAYRECEHIAIMNHYGPTEATIGCIAQLIKRSNLETYKKRPTIGKPIFNTKVYILDGYLNLLPPGIAGELCISGTGLAGGYFKRDELTGEKFVESALGRYYRTGDLGRWLPDGNIEFLGRIDHQVKVRGYRVELPEIENRLLQHEEITGAAVLVRNDNPGDRYLCGYITVTSSPSTGWETKIKEFLSETLPEYMIPSYLVTLEKLPLTPNGKLDSKALPRPDLADSKEYIAPTDHIEKKLVETWAKILNIHRDDTAHFPIGINGNFFELGGHSLKAIILLSKIHKEFNVKIPLAQLFNAPTIRGLAGCIKEAAPVEFTAIEPVEKKEHYPLSSAQKRLYILQQMEPEGTAYNMPETISLQGPPDVRKLENTFLQLINRHESLRTSFRMLESEPVQCIHRAVDFKIEYFDPAPMPSHFGRPFDLTRAPLLRVAVGKISVEDYVMQVDMHHIISDGVSHRVLVTDFMALYADEQLAPLAIQYKDFSQWQNGEKERQALKKQESYWLKEFDGAIPLLDLPTDFVRPVVRNFEGSSVSFIVEEAKALNELALQQGATLYMVLLSLFNVFLAKLSGQEDIVVGSPTAGRRHADLEPVIGVFVNTLAMRNYPLEENRFVDFLNNVKKRTVEAFDNQDYQFEDLVENLSVSRDTGRNPLFDALFVLQNVGPGLEPGTDQPVQSNSPGGRERPVEQNTPVMENRTSKFDLVLSGSESREGLQFSLGYSTKLFKRDTIERFLVYLRAILTAVLKNPAIKLSEIEILSAEEKRRLLYDFNDTNRQYPQNTTLHRLFENRAAKIPDNIAVVAMDHNMGPASLSYRELNEKATVLSVLLRKKGLHHNCIAALVTGRTLETITGIFAILKAGGAYMPLNPDAPILRTRFMLRDSGTRILLTQSSLIDKFRGASPPVPVENIISIDEHATIHDSAVNPAETPHPPPATRAQDPAYVIYTSGSTGKPKGV
ncbi:MAG: amino acid adenylation domain-containing protein, partial [bacterium]|nr:amino acid adenylation domain-containing protein [bacterium]